VTHAARYRHLSHCIDAAQLAQAFEGMGIGVRRRREDVDAREVTP